MTEQNVNPYRAFKTDKELEKEGIYLDYGAFRVKVGRAGGSNKRYLSTLEKKLRPHRRALQTETIADETAQDLVMDSFIDGAILGWEVKVKDGDKDVWKVGIHDPDTGEVIQPSREVYVKVLKALPDLFMDMREQASKTALFLQDLREAEGGNS
jgi:hypothetical protein